MRTPFIRRKDPCAICKGNALCFYYYPEHHLQLGAVDSVTDTNCAHATQEQWLRFLTLDHPGLQRQKSSLFTIKEMNIWILYFRPPVAHLPCVALINAVKPNSRPTTTNMFRQQNTSTSESPQSNLYRWSFMMSFSGRGGHALLLQLDRVTQHCYRSMLKLSLPT